MIVDANISKLNKLGFNHICFAVDDLEAEVAKLPAAGVKLRNKMMDFHDRKLVFLSDQKTLRLNSPNGIEIDAIPTDNVTFLTAASRKPFSAPGFTNGFQDTCNIAGLRGGTSAHGLRKAACRRLAEAGVQRM